MTTVMENWANNFDSVKIWLSKLQEKDHNAMYLYYFCYWAEIDPVKLLAMKDDRNNLEAEMLLEHFAADKNSGLTDAEKYVAAIAVKSFFKHNFRDLAKAAGAAAFQYQPKKQYKPSKEDLRKLYRKCFNPRDRSMLTMICSTAIAKGTLSELKWRNLEENWEEIDVPHIGIESGILKGHGRGKYKGVEQHCFLTPEAKCDLIEYKEWIERKFGRSLTKDDNIYWTTQEPFEPLSYKRIGAIFYQMAKEARVPFSSHDARRYVETALEEIIINPNWLRKIRGRKVRGEEAPYSKPEIKKLRAAYKRAVTLLQFTVAVEKPKVTREEIISKLPEEVLEPIAREHKISVGDIRRVMMRKVKARPGEHAKLSRITIPRYAKKKRNRATNGGNCNSHAIITEEQLLPYLDDGWEIVRELRDGRIVVRRQTLD